MEKLRSELAPVLAELLEVSAQRTKVELDTIGSALGSLAVSTEDIDLLLRALEDAGREITTPQGGGAERHLKQVVAAARTLKVRLSRRPTLAEVASEAKLEPEQVLVAFALLRVMQR